jgi:hypothetical protein
MGVDVGASVYNVVGEVVVSETGARVAGTVCITGAGPLPTFLLLPYGLETGAGTYALVGGATGAMVSVYWDDDSVVGTGLAADLYKEGLAGVGAIGK